jgi:hypothetical protein
MTIVPHREQIAGATCEGYQISCHKCHGSNFMKSVKHLPDDVVANKFRDRGWEVNSDTKDFCPNCIVLKRGPKKGTKYGPRAERDKRLQPVRDIEYLSADHLQKSLTSCGLAVMGVVELDHPQHRRFKVTLRTQQELPVGVLIHAETDVIHRYGVSLAGSNLKLEIKQEFEDNVVRLELVSYWYLTLENTRERLEAAE